MSADDLKRYFYAQTIEEQLEKKLTILMYNPSTLNGNDKTVQYIEKVCRYHEFGSYNIVNLIPQKGGNPDLISSYFDGTNFQILSRVLNKSTNPVWLGWGKMVKSNTEALFPEELKELLRKHSARLICVKISLDKNKDKYPIYRI